MTDNQRTIDDIRADMAANRVKIGVSSADLRETLNPKNIAKAGLDEAKQFAKAEYESAKAQFVGPDGGADIKRIAIIGGAVLGAVVFFATLNSIGHRRQLAKASRLVLEAAEAAAR